MVNVAYPCSRPSSPPHPTTRYINAASRQDVEVECPPSALAFENSTAQRFTCGYVLPIFNTIVRFIDVCRCYEKGRSFEGEAFPVLLIAPGLSNRTHAKGVDDDSRTRLPFLAIPCDLSMTTWIISFKPLLHQQWMEQHHSRATTTGERQLVQSDYRGH